MTEAAWYVLRISSGYEERVARTLRHTEGFDGFCPMRQEFDLIRNRQVARLRPLWPTYGFASWPLGDAGSWQAVLSGEPYLWNDGFEPSPVKSILPGVAGIIGGPKPVEVPRKYVDLLVAEANRDGTIPSLESKLEELRRGYVKGSPVRIQGGAFNEQTGICNWFDSTGVSVEVMFFGRSTAVFIGATDPHVRVVKDDSRVPVTKAAKRRDRDRRALAKKTLIEGAKYLSGVISENKS